MISVKKADGTVVRMTMAEFQAYRKQQTQPQADDASASPAVVDQTDHTITPAPIASDVSEPTPQFSPQPEPEEPESEPEPEPQPEPAPAPAPAERPLSTETPTQDIAPVSEMELATSTPVPDAFIHEARAAAKSTWQEDDHKSLLDEDLPDHLKNNQTLQAVPSRNDALLLAVLAALPFAVAEDVKGRLSSLIESRVKEVRSDDDVLMYAEKSIDGGGLGLTVEQADILLATILETLNLPPTAEIEQEETAAPVVPVAPTAPAIKSKPASPFHFDIPDREEYRFVPPEKPTSSIPHNAEGRPMVHDVQAVPVASMGPIDEFRNFTLTDLHRLGGNKQQMVAAVLEKFHFLRDESYVLYLDAIDAWYQCPLYRAYQTLLLTAVNEGISLATVLEYDQQGLRMEDVEAAAEIGKGLSY